MLKVKFYDTATNNEIEKEYGDIFPIVDFINSFKLNNENHCDCNRSKMMYGKILKECNDSPTILVKVYDEDTTYYTELEEVEKEWNKFLADMGSSAFGGGS